MAEILLSVIIPVYNVDSYLDQCLLSVFSQNIKALEVICVNDGSTDNSRAILQGYKDIYPQMVIIDKRNAGLPAARNSGYNVAHGKYIYFLDSDDYMLPEAFQKMLDFVVEKDLDLAYFNVLKQGTEPYFKITTDITDVLPGIELYCTNYKKNGFFPPSAVWMYLFKKEILDKFNIKFKEGIEHEDEEYTPRVHYLAQRDSYLNIPIQFHRVMRVGSVTAATNLLHKESNIRDLIETSNDLLEFFKKNQCEEDCFYQKIFEIYLSVAQIIANKIPDRKKYLFFPEDFQNMKECAIAWDWYVYYWLFRYNTILFKWYMSELPSPLLKKTINRIFKLYYR